MARYLLTEKAFINDALCQPGDVVEVADEFPPGPHMEPAKDEKGREDKAARAAKDKAGVAKASRPGDPQFIGDLIEHNSADGSTNGRVESSSLSAPAPGVKVDENGVVRGVTKADPVPGTAKGAATGADDAANSG